MYNDHQVERHGYFDIQMEDLSEKELEKLWTRAVRDGGMILGRSTHNNIERLFQSFSLSQEEKSQLGVTMSLTPFLQ